MKQLLTTSCIILCVLGLVPSDAAADGLFGPDESLHSIQRIEGTDYTLCHKTTIYFVGLGVYISDDGYVLRDWHDFDRYTPLTSEMATRFQSDGLLPDPLPQYSISFLDYAFGYSLWITLGVVIITSIIGAKLKRMTDGAAARKLLENAQYKEALRVALNAETDGLNRAVDYLHENGVPLTEAQKNMQLLLTQGEMIEV